MKKRITILATLLLAVVSVMSVVLAGCGMFGDNGSGDNNNQQPEPVSYTIQYTDDDGTHAITVKQGEPYFIEHIPSRIGYEFLGLYDAQEGGTQYVTPQGGSVAVFNEGKNMVLFPQFRVKEYKVVLDYRDAANGGVNELYFTYGAQIAGLPSMLYAPNKNFMGWYTMPNCEGKQVADQNGLPTATGTLDNSNFKISEDTNTIYLYAGFKGVPCNVTLYIDGVDTPQTVEVEYGTPASEIFYDYTIGGEEKRVVSWSLSPSSVADRKVFAGEIVGDTTLYQYTVREFGTEALPYEVATRDDFEKMLADSTSTSYYELVGDIDLGDWSEQGSYNWASESRNAPVAFTGNFNGNGHTISYSIRIGKTSMRSWAFGLFPTTDNANIKNLKVKANITTYDPLGRNEKWDIPNEDRAQDAMVGGIIGYAKNTTLTNCSTSGNIRYNSDGGESDTCVGGVIGYALSSTVSACSSSASLYSRGFYIAIGGVIACHFNSTCSGLTSSANISENNDWFFGQVYTNSTVARPNHEVLTKN